MASRGKKKKLWKEKQAMENGEKLIKQGTNTSKEVYGKLC
jgi:hypothetical protein